jgi:hypothetical protein
MIECSLIDLIPELGPILVSLIWLFWSGHTVGYRSRRLTSGSGSLVDSK